MKKLNQKCWIFENFNFQRSEILSQEQDTSNWNFLTSHIKKGQENILALAKVQEISGI